MPIELWFGFACAAGLAILTPGPTMLTVIRFSQKYGRLTSVPLLVGVVLGDATALLLSFATFLGLAQSDPSGVWLALVSLACGLCLLYFGFRLFRTYASPAGPNLPSRPRPRWRESAYNYLITRFNLKNVPPRWQAFAYAYLITALNVKTIPFLLTLLKETVDRSYNVPQQLCILAATFLALSMTIAALYMRFAPSARTLADSPRAQRGFQFAVGSLLSALGVWALFTAYRELGF